MPNARRAAARALLSIAPLAALVALGGAPAPALSQTTSQGVATSVTVRLHSRVNDADDRDDATVTGVVSAQNPTGAATLDRGRFVTDHRGGPASGGGSASGHASFSDIGLSGLARASARGATSGAFDYDVTATVFDLVTLMPSDSLTAGSHVTWEGRLTFDGGITNPILEATPDGTVFGGGTARAGGDAHVAITGTGLAACPYADGFCASAVRSISRVGGGLVTVDQQEAPVRDLVWRMDMVVGSPTAIALTMALAGQAFADVSGGSADAVFNADFSHTLRWAGTAVFRDAATGALLTDARLASGSGFDYGHPDTFGAAPEPARWALMVAGFGAAGGALRRRRRAAA